MKKPNNTKSHTQYILLLALFIFVGGELVSRIILGLGDPPLYVTHSKIEYMLKPNQNLYRFGNHIIVNNFGMRSDQFAKNKQKNE